MKFFIGLLSLISVAAIADPMRDIFPDKAFAPGKVKQEYSLAQSGFESGIKTPAVVSGKVAPGNYNCTYYLENYQKKEDITLNVFRGSLGKDSRALLLLGTKVIFKNPDAKKDNNGNIYYKNGPFAYLDVKAQSGNDVRFRFEIRIGQGETEGSFIMQIISGESMVDRSFDSPQFLACSL